MAVSPFTISLMLVCYTHFPCTCMCKYLYTCMYNVHVHCSTLAGLEICSRGGGGAQVENIHVRGGEEVHVHVHVFNVG